MKSKSKYTERIFAEKFMELGNLAAATLLFSNIFRQDHANNEQVLAGLAFLCFCYGYSIIVLKPNK